MTYSLVDATPRCTPTLGMERLLVAILSADVQGYSRLMRTDETATICTLKAYRGLMAALIQQYHWAGSLTIPAITCWPSFRVWSRPCSVRSPSNAPWPRGDAVLPRHRQMVFRMGLHVGDVVVDQERIYGEAVNLTARLEGLAEGGGLCISGTVYDHVVARLPLDYRPFGVWVSQDMPTPVWVYRVQV